MRGGDAKHSAPLQCFVPSWRSAHARVRALDANCHEFEALADRTPVALPWPAPASPRPAASKELPSLLQFCRTGAVHVRPLAPLFGAPHQALLYVGLALGGGIDPVVSLQQLLLRLDVLRHAPVHALHLAQAHVALVVRVLLRAHALRGGVGWGEEGGSMVVWWGGEVVPVSSAVGGSGVGVGSSGGAQVALKDRTLVGWA